MPRRGKPWFVRGGVCLGLLGPVSVAQAAADDQAARELAQEAIETHYLATDFAQAEKALKQGLELCVDGSCSASVIARLHRDLGIVYIAGLKQNDAGREQFERAVQLDSGIELNEDLATPEVREVFAQVKGPGASGAGSASGDEAMEDIEAFDEEGQGDPQADDPVRNWFSLSFQQDFLHHTAQQGACSGGNRYFCFFGDNTDFREPVRNDLGNSIDGGFAVATWRILLGFDRVIGSNFSVGVRAGWAVGGAPSEPGGGEAFFPLHLEARANYWFGSDPFAEGGLRPYLVVAAGVAQIDSPVLVSVIPEGEPASPENELEIEAWKKSGKGFISGGLGLQVAFARNHGPYAEFKYAQMLGLVDPSLNLQVGYALGF